MTDTSEVNLGSMNTPMTYEEYYEVIYKKFDCNEMVDAILNTIGKKDAIRKRVRFPKEATERLLHEY